MSKFRAAACGLALAAGFAVPAFAGPVGSGLSLTEETARRALAARTLTIAAADGCLSRARDSLKDHPAVQAVRQDAGKISVVFHSAAHAAQHRDAVNATLSQSCA